MSRQLREIASWRLVAEVVRRHPHRLRVIETHPGGGQYDCLTLVEYIPARAANILLQLNRAGSAHGAGGSYPGVWEHAVQTDDPKGLVDRLSGLAGLPLVEHVPPSAPSVIVYRTIAALLAPAALGRSRYECRNGYLDTSGGTSEVPAQWFALFPSAQEALENPISNDPLDVAAYRFWFLLRDTDPLLCFEISGRAWDRSGKVYDLAAAYRKSSRIWAVAGPIAAALFE